MCNAGVTLCVTLRVMCVTFMLKTKEGACNNSLTDGMWFCTSELRLGTPSPSSSGDEILIFQPQNMGRQIQRNFRRILVGYSAQRMKHENAQIPQFHMWNECYTRMHANPTNRTI